MNTFLGILTLGLVAYQSGSGCTNNSDFNVTSIAGNNGSISENATSTNGQFEFTITPDAYYSIEDVTGTCGGTLLGNIYTTNPVTSDCTVIASFGPPSLSLTPSAIKNFRFQWRDVSEVTQYKILENPDGLSGYTEVAALTAEHLSHDLPIFLPTRINASYLLMACNSDGCGESDPVFISGTLAEAVGHVKPTNTDFEDHFSLSVSLSSDGNTLAVGSVAEDSNSVGVNGDQLNNAASNSGAVYVFTNSNGSWTQQAYLKASNAGVDDNFGMSISLSNDGSTLAVGAVSEDSNATGVNGDQFNNLASGSGAVFVFSRNGSAWSQQAYVKASNTGSGDGFGVSVALSTDGNTLAVGATAEASGASGINGDQSDNSANQSGAVYLFTRNSFGWSQQAYLKASNTGAGDTFGTSLALTNEGNTLAVGAIAEGSSATGINGNQADNSAPVSGAVYVFNRSGAVWSQQAYIKASNTDSFERFGGSVSLADSGDTLAVGAYFENGDIPLSGAVYVFSRNSNIWTQDAYLKASNPDANDRFGAALTLSGDGNSLAVGALFESSNAIGVGGDQNDNSALKSGAVYLFNYRGGSWLQQAYVKASNNGTSDYFGYSVAMARDGDVLAVGAYMEDSNAIGLNGDQADDSTTNSGVVYLY